MLVVLVVLLPPLPPTSPLVPPPDRYVLIASVAPLCAFVYNDGVVKFCSRSFSLDGDEALGDPFRHLANYALNKHNEEFDESTEEGEGAPASSPLRCAREGRLVAGGYGGGCPVCVRLRSATLAT